MLNDIESPSELSVRGKVRGVTRFNRLPVFIGGGIVAVFLIAVLVGMSMRSPGGTDSQTAQGGVNAKLRPETMAQRDFLKNAPTGVILAAKVDEKPARPPEEPSSMPADLPDLSMPPMTSRRDGAQQATSVATGAVQAMPAAPAAPTPQEEAARRALEEIEKVRFAAYTAGTSVAKDVNSSGQSQNNGGGVGGFPGTGSVSSAPGQPTLLQLASAARSLGLGQANGATAPQQNAFATAPQLQVGEDTDPNKQERKEAFLRGAQQTPESTYLRSTRTAPLGEFEVKAGWTIPAVMEHGINSDLPGQLTARVSQNVYDTATGRFLLIPQGTRLVGEYDSQVAFGQEGLLVVWKRLIFPDASSMSIGGMGGSDESGYAGFRDQVNNHYGRIFGWGLLTSLFGVAYQLSQPTNTVNPLTNTAVPTNQQIAASSVGTEMSRLAAQIARKNLNIQPTIEIRPGYRFFVRVEKDLLLARPYAYGNVQ